MSRGLAVLLMQIETEIKRPLSGVNRMIWLKVLKHFTTTCGPSNKPSVFAYILNENCQEHAN